MVKWKKILFIISEELNRLGWEKSSIDKAEYIFSVDYEMGSKQVTQSGSTPVAHNKTTKTTDPNTGQHIYNTTKTYTQQSYSKTYDIYERSITIRVQSRESGELIWTADCISKGTTQDILYPSKYMVPYAISKFPEEGIWKQREIVKNE